MGTPRPPTRQRVSLREMLQRPHDEVSVPPNDKQIHQDHHTVQQGIVAPHVCRRDNISSGLASLALQRKPPLPLEPDYYLESQSSTSSSSSVGFGGGDIITSAGSGSSSSSQSPRELEYDEDHLHHQNLLPGIPNRVTIEGILTKCSWKTLCTLAAVNRAWRNEMRSRRVHKARNCIDSAKPLVIVTHRASAVPQSAADHYANFVRSGPFVPAHWRYAMSIYDPTNDVWHLLPPIPGVSSGIPKSCECAFLNGKVYVIGGDDYDKAMSNREVYAIDLAACRGVWEKCASMKTGRSEFPCEAYNGRIYVFGGGYQPELNYSRGAEVFDPERNEWLEIEETTHQRTNHTAVALDGKLYVIGGSVWLDEEDDLLYERLDCDDMFDSTLHARFAEVYDPWKKNWRKVENVTKRETDDAFVMVHGRLHVLRPDSVHVYDSSSNSWTFLQHISWEVQACIGAKDCCVCAAAFIDGELLALVGRTSEEDYGLILLKSKCFYRRNCDVTWEPVSCPQEFDPQFFSVCRIQL